MKKAVFIILRILGAALLVLMIGWFLAPYFRWGTHNIGNVAGISLCLWGLLLLSPLRRKITALCARHAFTKWLWRIVNACFAAFVLYGAALTGFILFAAAKQPQQPSTVVLLGAKVSAGGRPTLILDGRITADEWMLYPISFIGIPLLELPWWSMLVFFCVVRAVDIIKPWPCRGLQAIPGGLGIVIDDFVANIYSLGINWAIYWYFFHG